MCVFGASGEVFCLHLPSLARESLLLVNETPVRKNLRGLKESVACTPSSNLDCAIFLGVVRAIWLNPTNAIVGLPTKLPDMKMMTPANHMSIMLTPPLQICFKLCTQRSLSKSSNKGQFTACVVSVWCPRLNKQRKSRID